MLANFENVNGNSAFEESIELEFIFKDEPALDLLAEMRAFEWYASIYTPVFSALNFCVTLYLIVDFIVNTVDNY